jgi:hypothetical protein
MSRTRWKLLRNIDPDLIPCARDRIGHDGFPALPFPVQTLTRKLCTALHGCAVELAIRKRAAPRGQRLLIAATRSHTRKTAIFKRSETCSNWQPPSGISLKRNARSVIE